MQIKQLEYFLSVANHLSMNEAAKRLFICQPTLSASIAALELELGVTLFERTNKGVKLTQEALEIYDDCQSIVDIVQRWKYRYQKTSDAVCNIWIAATPVICDTVLTDVVVECNQLYQNVDIRIHEQMVPTPLIPPQKNEASIAVGLYEETAVSMVYSVAALNHWKAETIFQGQSYVFVNAKSRLAKQEKLYMKQLSDLKIVTYSELEQGFPYGQVIQSFKKRKVQMLPNRQSMMKAISADESVIGIFSEMVIQDNYYIAKGLIKPMLVADFPMPIAIILFLPETIETTSRLYAVAEKIKEKLWIVCTQSQE